MLDRTSHAPNLRALVVEDDVVTREFLVEALTHAGWTVAWAASIAVAIGKSREWPPRLLLCDVRLPDGDAFALAVELALGARTGSRASYAIALSAELEPALRGRLIDAGYDEVLPKPLAIDRLMSSLSQAKNATTLASRDMPARVVREVAVVTSAVGSADAVILDDDAALEACGNWGTVEALRRLLADELPGCLQRLAEAHAEGDSRTSSEILHRLRSASGFCGASALALAVSEACRDQPQGWQDDSALARVLREGHALLGQFALYRAQQQLTGT